MLRRGGGLSLVAQVVAFLTGLLLTVPMEIRRVQAAAATKLGLLAWFFEFNLDTTLPLILLTIAPVLWFVRAGRSAESESSPTDRAASSIGVAWMLAIVCALTSIAASAWIASQRVGGEPGVRFGDLPPAYHDEFSYLFQSQTFLAGHLSFPSSPRMPELFDQMHVVNEGRFASRYFPGVGLWTAPFLAIGHPYWGQWFAGGLAAFFIFWTGRELAGSGVGFFAGMLTALSPGMGLFSNLLLAHHPTIAALSLFLFAFLRFVRTERPRDALWAGIGLSYAMLCRPMTAAGFGLPFGIWFLWWLLASHRRRPAGDTRNAAHDLEAPADLRRRLANRLTTATALASPIVLGLVLMFFYNRAITGDGLISPYQLYTDAYTPRHVYGFNNVVRGERKAGPRAMESYDLWAQNLTPALAAENVVKRTKASAEWSLGLVPLAMAGILFLVYALWHVDRRWRLVALAILSLHAVHVPYWFVGISNWHYVFETGPLLLLIFAVTTQVLFRLWKAEGRFAMRPWWGALIAVCVVTNWTPFDPFWSVSRIEAGIDEVAYSRLFYAGFDRLIDQSVTQRPALVLIEPDPADRSMDLVYNDPDLTAPILRGRYRPHKTDLAKVRAAFPDRTLYLLRVKPLELRRLSR
jgi:hypothetical protein